MSKMLKAAQDKTFGARKDAQVGDACTLCIGGAA